MYGHWITFNWVQLLFLADHDIVYAQLVNVVNTLNVGSIDIATSEVSGRQMTDRWFTLTTASPAVRKDGRPVPSSPAVVRIKVNFRSIKILPVDLYKPLIEVCRHFIHGD